MKHSTILLRDGFRVGVTQGGQGTPLVFLHGLGASAGIYTEMLELLAANGFEVIALDLPDHGRSDSLPWGHTVRDMAYIVRQALDRLMVHGKAIVVGHSMGGGVAVQYASMYPGNVSTAILMNAAAGEEHHHAIRVDRSPITAIRAAQYFAGAFRDLAGDTRQIIERRGLSGALSLGNKLRKGVSGLGSLKAAYALMQADTELALRTMKRFGVRTVVIHGTEDRIVPKEAAYSAARLTSGRLHLLGRRYHCWMLVEPELALEVIQKALKPIPEVRAG